MGGHLSRVACQVKLPTLAAVGSTQEKDMTVRERGRGKEGRCPVNSSGSPLLRVCFVERAVPAASLVGILIPLAHRTLSPQLQSSHRPSAFLLVTLRMSSQGKVNENEKL